MAKTIQSTIEELHKNGMRNCDIARIVGMEQNTVASRIWMYRKKNGIKPPKPLSQKVRELIEAGLSNKEVAVATGATQSYVRVVKWKDKKKNNAGT